MTTRRDWLLFTATAAVGVGVAGTAWVALTRASGPADTGEAWVGLPVDVSGLTPGTEISVLFQDTAIVIRRRTAQDIARARQTPISELPDAHGRNANAPDADASDANRTIAPFEGPDEGEWLVVQAICTHLGCVPFGDRSGDFQGWLCPCHGAHFDGAGRVRLGPAPTNLPIPVAHFTEPGILRLMDLGRYGLRR